jgi:heme-degrading monooxygenase HmoA
MRHIAQMNVGTARYPLDDPRIAEFMGRLDEVNALADAAPGFVWRLKSADGNATSIKVSDDPLFIVNMSVWESVEALFDFVYRTSHRNVMAKRRDWFERPDGAYMVLWWVPAGTTPTPLEGLERLRWLDQHGPSAHAFDFRHKFPPPGGAGSAEDMEPQPYCVGWA